MTPGVTTDRRVHTQGKRFVPPPDGGVQSLLAPQFAPGQAPFRVKGNAYRGHQEFVESSLPGGAAAQRESLRMLHPIHGPQWVEIFDQPFLASRWYDVYPLAVAGIACALISGEPFLDFVHRRTCIQAANDIRAMHRLLLRFVSTRTIAKRVPLVASQYFDFVTASAHDDDDVRVSGELGGIPLDLAPWWATIANAYVGTAIEIARGHPTLIGTDEYVMTGEAHGVPVCSVFTSVRLEAARRQA